MTCVVDHLVSSHPAAPHCRPNTSVAVPPSDLDVWGAAAHHPLLQSRSHLQEEETLRITGGAGHHGPQFPASGSRVDGRVQGEHTHTVVTQQTFTVSCDLTSCVSVVQSGAVSVSASGAARARLR